MMNSTTFLMRILAVAGVGAATLFTPTAVLACEKCFGAGSDSPVVTAIGLSMATLAIVTGFVLTGITKFFRDMTVRARKLQDAGYTERVSEN